MLPDLVKASVASFDFRTESQRALKTADEVWQSLQSGSGAHIAAVGDARNDATSGTRNSGNNVAVPDGSGGDVAAFTGSGRGRRGGRGQRSRGSNRGGGNGRGGHSAAPLNSAPQEVLPENLCSMHKKHKKRAFYCARPSDCPWRDFKYQPLDQN